MFVTLIGRRETDVSVIVYRSRYDVFAVSYQVVEHGLRDRQ